MFGLNGTLLRTFTNPAPAGDLFGYAVAAMGADKVLISAWSDNTNAGAAYLFSTNGTLLSAFTNPAPTAIHFGDAVASVGDNTVVVGHQSANSAFGAAHLFLPAPVAPPINVTVSSSNLLLSWPTNAVGYQPQENSNLAATNWNTITTTPTVTNGQNQITILPTNSQSFFRLYKP